MAKKHKVSDEVVAEALQVTKATQRPGQTKEQTKFIAQGVQKGIEEYKKRHKEKSRALDKQKRKLRQTELSPVEESEKTTEIVYKQNRLSWWLLLASWIGFIGYAVYFSAH